MILKYDRDEVVNLILAYLKGELNSVQKKKLMEWVETHEENRLLFDRLCDEKYVQEEVRDFQQYNSREDWGKVEKEMKRSRRNIVSRLLAYAAITIVLVSIGGVLYYMQEKGMYKVDRIEQSFSVSPGTSKAMLVMGNEKTIFLATGKDTVCRQVEGESFYNDGTKLVYTDTTAVKSIKWHTLKVPRGGEYMLYMSDGTRVILNADSKIRYPNRFADNQRFVELEGEAYFEVRQDSSKPFIVQADKLRITVLGTTFNLKAYPDESKQTTLVEGRVAVSVDREAVEIKPGEQAVWEGDELIVKKVDIQPYTAWVKQRFVFENESLSDVLKKLERWYDIQVVLKDASLRNIRFTGNLPKYEDIDKVLKKLELAARVHFELKERVLVVYKE